MDIINYHNDLNTLKVGNLTEKELDLFFSVIFKMKDIENDTITIDFYELKQLAETTEHKTRLIKNLENFSNKLLSLNQMIELEDGRKILFNLFRTFVIDPNENTLQISINKDFQYLLNNLVDHFTKFDLKQLVRLRSSYSKQIFKELKQFETKGKAKFFYIVKLEKFREKLSVPTLYTNIKFYEKILNPVVKELEPLFKNLTMEKLTKDNKLVTRGKKTDKIKFSWELEKKQISHKKTTIRQKTFEKIKEPKMTEEEAKKNLELLKKNYGKFGNKFKKGE